MDDMTQLPQLTGELSADEISAYQLQADQLSAKYGAKVTPVVFITPVTGNRVAAYLKEPSYMIKIRIMDKAASTGMYSANDEMREICTLKEESDSITYGESPECDEYKLALTDACIKFMRRASDQWNKKK